jgi:cell division protein FtsL
VVVCTLIAVAMAGAAAFQTQLAQRQVQLDRIESEIQAARQQYEQLRRERAELRSPARLSEVAQSMGMVPASANGFMVISAEVVATVRESAGTLGADAGRRSGDQLAQFRQVKSVSETTP